MRNFLVSLAPVVASNNYGAQVTLILALFVLWLIGQCRIAVVKPVRNKTKMMK